ncbi:MAG: Tat proofreading chaperone DmsD [Eggerthellaceae bacterium]|nr:Tat proofreading chaperone DmsD [Eggerthellaceae bacterium]
MAWNQMARVLGVFREGLVMVSRVISEEIANQVAFIGESLGPLFTHDPKLEGSAIRALLKAFVQMDTQEAGKEWPFVEDQKAAVCIREMQEGLAPGFEDQALYWEYRRLFVGPQKKAAPPWGSVYMDREQVIFGATTMKLHDWMRHNGVGVKKGTSDEPEDHLGTLLIMMAYIARNKPEVLVEYLRLHVLTWSSHFLELMENEAHHPFYHGLASLARLSLEGIQETLQIEVVYPRYYR